MRKLVLSLLIVMPMVLLAQKEISLKKRYLGKYVGTIPAYKLDAGAEVLQVSSSAIYIMLEKERIEVTIGNRLITGTYYVMFEAKKYYLLDAKMNGQLANERIMVYKRGRKIARDGLFPQPFSALKKKR